EEEFSPIQSLTAEPEVSSDPTSPQSHLLMSALQPSHDRSSSTKPPLPVHQESTPSPISPVILHTYSGLSNRQTAVYVSSFSLWVPAGALPEKDICSEIV
uniref:Uncharacterized protein n=1 Tax=Phocoena sinus TaxID=42100 RepID=A0A8C9E6M1_PHOSS